MPNPLPPPPRGARFVTINPVMLLPACFYPPEGASTARKARAYLPPTFQPGNGRVWSVLALTLTLALTNTNSTFSDLVLPFTATFLHLLSFVDFVSRYVLRFYQRTNAARGNIAFFPTSDHFQEIVPQIW